MDIEKVKAEIRAAYKVRDVPGHTRTHFVMGILKGLRYSLAIIERHERAEQPTARCDECAAWDMQDSLCCEMEVHVSRDFFCKYFDPDKYFDWNAEQPTCQEMVDCRLCAGEPYSEGESCAFCDNGEDKCGKEMPCPEHPDKGGS